MILAPGIHEIPAGLYHSDELCEQPSLSSSLAKILWNESPAHARMAHPRLNATLEREEEEKFDIGTAAHLLLLEGNDEKIVVVEADDWRTNAAKAARAEARIAGKLPLLRKYDSAVRAMAAAARERLDALNTKPAMFAAGKCEQTLIWDDPEYGVRCRARLDWLRDDFGAIDDYKTTSRSASPDEWARRTMFGIGGDIQAAFYLRGLEALTGEQAEFRFVIQETYPPYALAIVSPDPAVLVCAQMKVRWALQAWERALLTGDWPGYPAEVCWAELPPYEEARVLERFARETTISGRGAA